MSQSIWTRCAGRSRVRPLGGRFWRVVESQFRNSTRQLVDSDAEQEILESLLDKAKNPVPRGFENLHYLLYTPFRYPPLPYGSRFGTRFERGILYGARELPTAFAEAAYYRLLFLEGSRANLGEVHLDLTALRFGVHAKRGVDLSIPPFQEHEGRISSRTSYAHAQRLGAEMRTDGVEVFLSVSARAEPRALNIGVLENVFSPRRPVAERPWSCTASREKVEFRARMLLEDERHAFARGQFEVNGRLPAPATG